MKCLIAEGIHIWAGSSTHLDALDDTNAKLVVLREVSPRSFGRFWVGKATGQRDQRHHHDDERAEKEQTIAHFPRQYFLVQSVFSAAMSEAQRNAGR